MNLATFIHVSDLHFGRLDISDLDSNNAWWKVLVRLQGFLGHGANYIRSLVRVSGHLRRTESASLIVTGDLTTCGRTDEFGTVDLYLGSVPTSNTLSYLGLRCPDWKKYAISGNHDQWPGHCSVLGYANPVVYQWFYDLPRISPTLSLRSGHELTFLWIDSDANVGPFSYRRVLAHGSFCSQLQELQRRLSTPGKREIRVLAIHHSPTFAGHFLQIDSWTRKELESFIVTNKISVVLCGHLHNPPYVQVASANNSVSYLEARCGSTTQANFDDLKPHERQQLRVRGLTTPKETNSLLVHRLVQEAGGIFWETEIWLDDIGRFRKPDYFTLQNGQSVTTRFRILP